MILESPQLATATIGFGGVIAEDARTILAIWEHARRVFWLETRTAVSRAGQRPLGLVAPRSSEEVDSLVRDQRLIESGVARMGLKELSAQVAPCGHMLVSPFSTFRADLMPGAVGIAWRSEGDFASVEQDPLFQALTGGILIQFPGTVGLAQHFTQAGDSVLESWSLAPLKRPVSGE